MASQDSIDLAADPPPNLIVDAVLASFVQQGSQHGIIPMMHAFRDWVRAHCEY